MGTSFGLPDLRMSLIVPPIIPTVLFISASLLLVSGDDCDYRCEPNGSCTVTYVGPSRPGQLSGSCFPDSFGGSCSGTPPECRDCNKVRTCSEGGTSSGSRPSRPSRPSSSSSGSENCKYSCTSGGGCQVEWAGPFRPGQTQGSCFPQSFGGSCSGTPRECKDCNR